jgi:hypothetical protein
MSSVPIGRPMRKDADVHVCLSSLYTMQATFNCSFCRFLVLMWNVSLMVKMLLSVTVKSFVEGL